MNTISFFKVSPARSSFFFCLAAVLGLPMLVAAQSVAPAAKPNIVYILADDLGYGDVSALNPGNKIKTPQIDKLIAESMTFTEAHASSAVCTPSRYSILTGRYNWRSTMKEGVLGGFSKPLIESGRMTVADLLKDHGYDTACIGKWHLGMGWTRLPAAKNDADDEASSESGAGQRIDFTKNIRRGPTTVGFDYFFGISASLDMPPYAFIEDDHVTALPTILRGRLIGVDGKQTGVGPQVPGFEAVDVLPTLTAKAVDYIERHSGSNAGGKRFFLYLALPTPHTPLAPSKEWLGKSGLNAYADYVMETDDCIGKVLAALKKNNVAGNTLVVLASDNGCSPAANFPFLLAHGHDPSAGRRGYKADIYDGGHRIPLLVRWPGRVAAGARCDGFVCLGDFMATCADLLKAKLPDNAGEDSVSFLPVLLNEAKITARQVLVESSINGSFGLREGQWKLALCPDSGGWSFPRPGKDNTDGSPRFQLFDVSSDPAEKTNVMSQHLEIVQRLGRLMRDYIINGRSTPGALQKNTPVKSWQQTKWIEEFAPASHAE
ncbi:MAG TPA: arylsulfatase [Verrucomicrobiae bacterium]|nr:arylsulfatase [Verrucomicrobiae bacterium]